MGMAMGMAMRMGILENAGRDKKRKELHDQDVASHTPVLNLLNLLMKERITMKLGGEILVANIHGAMRKQDWWTSEIV